MINNYHILTVIPNLLISSMKGFTFRAFILFCERTIVLRERILGIFALIEATNPSVN